MTPALDNPDQPFAWARGASGSYPPAGVIYAPRVQFVRHEYPTLDELPSSQRCAVIAEAMEHNVSPDDVIEAREFCWRQSREVDERAADSQ